MNNFLGAIPALIGVAVGVAATGWTDRVRWKRGQEVRWDERRIDAYAEYARANKKMHMTALRLVDPHLAGDNPAEPINREAGLEMLAQAEAHRGERWELILLLADQATAHAALRWHTLVASEAKFARIHPDDAESPDWIATVRSADKARDLFYEAARNSVNVGGGSVAIAQLLPAVARTDADHGQSVAPVAPADL